MNRPSESPDNEPVPVSLPAATGAATPAGVGQSQESLVQPAEEESCGVPRTTRGSEPVEQLPGGETTLNDQVAGLATSPEEDGQIPGWLPPGVEFVPQLHTPRELIFGLWQTGGQPILCARRIGCSPRLVKNHIEARRLHWEEANFSRTELFELCALMLRQAVQRMDRWAVSMVGKTTWGLQALAPIPEPEHQWCEAEPTPPVQELIPQVLEGLLDERHSIFLRCATRAGGHPDPDGPDRLTGEVDARAAPHGD